MSDDSESNSHHDSSHIDPEGVIASKPTENINDPSDHLLLGEQGSQGITSSLDVIKVLSKMWDEEEQGQLADNPFDEAAERPGSGDDETAAKELTVPAEHRHLHFFARTKVTKDTKGIHEPGYITTERMEPTIGSPATLPSFQPSTITVYPNTHQEIAAHRTGPQELIQPGAVAVYPTQHLSGTDDNNNHDEALESQTSGQQQDQPLIEATLVTQESGIPQAQIVDPSFWSQYAPNSKQGKRICFCIFITLAALATTGIVCGSGLCTPNSDDDNENTPDASFLPEYTKQTIAQNSFSPQARALDWVHQHPDFDSMPDWRKRQLMALCAVYYATGGGISWGFDASTDWLDASMNECDWEGVASCNTVGVYQYMNLREGDLKGSIPVEISFLTALTTLALGYNQFSGSFPTELGELTSLIELDLMGTQPRDPPPTALPTELGQLTALTGLQLSYNQFTGPLPTELGQLTWLKYLWLGDNQFSGPLPTELTQLTSLSKLSLGDNKFTGPLPTEIGKLTTLDFLSLDNSQFTGPLPTEMGKLTRLYSLSLEANRFTGPIPSELGQLAVPSFLNLTSLSLEDNLLTSSIPTELGQLTALKYLLLHNNTITGTLPIELGLLSSMSTLRLFANSLTGPIPSELGQLAAMTYLGLHENQLVGQLPTELGLLTALTSLMLHDNQFAGSIPTELWALRNLVALFLYNNSLTGTIPSSVCGFADLNELLIDCDLVACNCSQCQCL